MRDGKASTNVRAATWISRPARESDRARGATAPTCRKSWTSTARTAASTSSRWKGTLRARIPSRVRTGSKRACTSRTSGPGSRNNRSSPDHSASCTTRPARDRHDDARVSERSGVGREHVAVEHREIRPLADLDRSGARLVVVHDRGSHRERVERLRDRQSLIRQERLRLAVPGIHPRDRDLHLEQRVRRGHRPVAPAGERRARAGQIAERVLPSDPLLPHPRQASARSSAGPCTPTAAACSRSRPACRTAARRRDARTGGAPRDGGCRSDRSPRAPPRPRPARRVSLDRRSRACAPGTPARRATSTADRRSLVADVRQAAVSRRRTRPGRRTARAARTSSSRPRRRS